MTKDINTAAVVGTGYMGGGIAQSLAFAGVDVQLADANPELTKKAFERLLTESEQFEQEGLFKPGSTAILKERLRAADSIESAVASVDFVHEAVPEVPEIKRDVLGRISRAVRSDAIVASNTSTLPISGLAEAFEDASHFLGVHFSNPAPFIPGVSPSELAWLPQRSCSSGLPRADQTSARPPPGRSRRGGCSSPKAAI